MGEKTYDAIYKVAKNTDSDIITLWLNHKQITGVLLDCQDNKCISGVVTLQDATVKCMKNPDAPEKHFRWINVPACHIQAFTFKCCFIDD